MRLTVERIGSWLHTFKKSTLLIEAVRFTAREWSPIKSKTIDLGFVMPVAKAIRDQLNHASMRQIQSVTGSGVVYVVARDFQD